ncbi:uncharacterized protein LOC118312883 [Scophthalmus maximus]|uniref:uncharacterized protein LOC118312883 n=1 Tax=Scophthalmus maximus TaxID=52904 RepID=UPI0015E0D752|nr:uncharacterized protein LOC118312883 [Scophthalmus maximus]XP_035493818.1 uncharacterized protein LOC118312883 [Scophthalmus maximus]XP_035493819.1 uncharacterized protein LOC118312883 [Scophthalmus maximus]XP_035493821.1 uncharacterized protein LOC118312883 [Scophthalmus maximus]XP_035493822.1 uncharacterized protein LOC118312883 [Scophthalmus maximus]XP_035493823.1 uncharacterized protein LOC118312883 [Scophthalmus maximus]
MQHIWQIQRRHVKCIQDEPGVLLYSQTGTTTKERIVLPNYRCARGSTSLQSIHLHLNRFIPGTSANSLNFQLYLLEGLKRWNQVCHAASQAVKPPALLSYSGDLVHCVNTHSVKVLGRKLVPLFSQQPFTLTGQALQDVHPDSEETEQMLEDVGTEEELDVESFEDAGLSLSLDPTIELLDLSITRTISSASIPIPSSLHLSASRSAAAATEQHLRRDMPSGPSALPASSRLPVVLLPASKLLFLLLQLLVLQHHLPPPMLHLNNSCLWMFQTESCLAYQLSPLAQLLYFLFSQPHSQPLSLLLQLLLWLDYELSPQQHLSSNRLWMSVVSQGWTV